MAPDPQPSSGVPAVEPQLAAKLRSFLDSEFVIAEAMTETQANRLEASLGAAGPGIRNLAKKKHAGRGVFLTLSAYKAIQPSQDVRFHKREHADGFGARSIDSEATVPFLRKNSLPSSVESHWLSQTFSFAGPYLPDSILKTTPREVGPLLIEAINAVQASPASAQGAVRLVLYELVQERNRNRVAITRPKNLTIGQTLRLVKAHMAKGYASNGPRLPQLAVYAIYSCLVPKIERYRGHTLDPLGRMKAADRKARTVGDVVVSLGGRPVEAVETKLDVKVSTIMVTEAIEKIRTASVERYYILSTAGVQSSEAEEIVGLCERFRASNGCEIIINGVLETIAYYMRLLPTTNEFIAAYGDLIESDVDLDYEHRIAWNTICAEFAGP